ncbi:MAG TPA: hypothetical protein VJ063_12065 [Verrucomicrobiae bacterium]|nr:hypothetical protein [Verrucomicrobiae bacterium]
MKTFPILNKAARRPRPGSAQAGSILVMTIIFCALIGLILMAYLSMVKAQHKFTYRAQTWNNCIPLCEAGLEEAMAHINHINTTTNFAVNNWKLTGGYYRKERTLNDGTIKMVIDQGVPPVITVTGYLRAPIQSNQLIRAVRVKTRINYKFNYAMLGKGTIDISGGALIDSYNSTDPLKSTGGQYDITKRTADAIVATSSKALGSVKIGNLDVYGKIAVGPGGTVDKVNGTVGDVTWVNNPANDGKIQPGHFTDDVNLYIPDVQMPSPFAGLPPVGGIVGGVTYNAILPAGDWMLPSISGNDYKILVTGKARLYVAGGTTIGNNGALTIANGGSLEFFSNGNIDMKGAVNNPGLPKNLSFLGMPNCKMVGINAGAQFACSIYAPQADVSITGGGEGYGAVVANTFKLSGGMRWHYDQGLQGDPLEGRYVASSWQELDPPKN